MFECFKPQIKNDSSYYLICICNPEALKNSPVLVNRLGSNPSVTVSHGVVSQYISCQWDITKNVKEIKYI